MKKHERFDSYEEYVDYLECRVHYLEHRLAKYRNNRSKSVSKRKRHITELAQPLHKKVVFTIPLPNNPYNDPLEITFVSRTTTTNGKRYHSIDMFDIIADRSEQISKMIDLQDHSNFNASLAVRNWENDEIEDFANHIADRYGDNNPSDMDYIKKVILSCYNEVVVDHKAKPQLKLPTDQYWVTCDSHGNIVLDA